MAFEAAVRVEVFDFESKPLDRADVTLAPAARGAGRTVKLRRDAPSGSYRATGVRPGAYRLRVRAKGYDGQERALTVSGGEVVETVVLGRAGMALYYRGRVPLPFERRPELVGVSFSRTAAEELRGLFGELNMTVEPLDEAVSAQGFALLKLPRRAGAARRREVVERLREHPAVKHAGPVVGLSDGHLAFATDELVVKFEPSVTEAQVSEFERRAGMALVRSLPYAGNAYLFRAREPASYELLERFGQLAGDSDVEYAEPNLVSSVAFDQVVPTDHLYADQWHLPFVNLPDAWQALRDHDPPGVMPGADGDLTFGGQDVVIAVMDEGVESRSLMGVTTPHPDFTGAVTGGALKMFGWFDFESMVPDNNSPLGSHGTSCAGVAAALADNPSPVAGENEGVVGAAGNSRVLGLIAPFGYGETEFSDAYVWAAGFDPHSTRAGFPAPLARGADAITNSFGVSVGSPISGLMKDCFDYLTTYGRGGRGLVLFFSAGNANTVFNLQRPWAAYERTFAIAASTDGDVRASYSNYGNGIDVCAPSDGGTQAITTSTRVGAGTLAGHTGGSNDYVSSFGGTSSATPLTAGVAALMITVNPSLTWVELRHILRATAVKIDFANTDPVGQWVDSDGDGVKDYSQWYGYGRIDAHAAVVGARDFTHDIDVVVRENVADVGSVPAAGWWADSPDVWVRTQDPATDGAAALPADYTTPGPHQNPVAGSSTNYVYARVKNIGAEASYDYYVRLYVAHFPGTEFTYPASFIPTSRPSAPVTAPLQPGTYLIGEVHHSALAAGAVDVVNVNWPAALIPPADVMVGAMSVHWHPCLLVEVAPHDGPAASGPHVWDDNNLAQKNISIVYPDSSAGDDFATAVVVGGAGNDSPWLELSIDRSRVPATVQLYLQLADAGLMRALRDLLDRYATFAQQRPEAIRAREFMPSRVATLDARAAAATRARTMPLLPDPPLRLGQHHGRPVVWLASHGRTRVPLLVRSGEQTLVTIGGIVAPGVDLRGQRIEVVQLDADGRASGGYSIELRAAKR